MAKASEKPTPKKVAAKKEKSPKAEVPKKSAPAKKVTAPAKKTAAGPDIVTAAESSLSKLRELNIDPQLQADIEWCLGSYQHDNNPAGLYEMVGRAVRVFTLAKDNKSKGVTSKFIADLQKSLPAA